MTKIGATLAVAGAVGGLAASNRRLAKVGEPARIGGEEQRYPWRGWRLAYQVAGDPGAQPLLLRRVCEVHGPSSGSACFRRRTP